MCSCAMYLKKNSNEDFYNVMFMLLGFTLVISIGMYRTEVL